MFEPGLGECPGNERRDDELSLIVGECGFHESAHVLSSYALGGRMRKYCCNAHVECLTREIGCPNRSNGSHIEVSLQVVGLGNSIFHKNMAGHVYNVCNSLRRLGI